MCTSTQGDQPFNITWYRDGRALKIGEQTDTASSSTFVTSSTQRHHFDERTIEINTIQSFSSILTIHNITSQHNGNYTCQISNPAGVVDYSVALSVSGKYSKSKIQMKRKHKQFFVVFDKISLHSDVNARTQMQFAPIEDFIFSRNLCTFLSLQHPMWGGKQFFSPLFFFTLAQPSYIKASLKKKTHRKHARKHFAV